MWDPDPKHLVMMSGNMTGLPSALIAIRSESGTPLQVTDRLAVQAMPKTVNETVGRFLRKTLLPVTPDQNPSPREWETGGVRNHGHTRSALLFVALVATQHSRQISSPTCAGKRMNDA
jgi:hypothetical protein